jgi:predicted Ser/Thr protein kinase
MASLSQAIHAFQSGSLSHQEFLAQVDGVLATDQANSARLREILSEEHTRILLPPEVYSELQQRVENLTHARQPAGADETPMKAVPRDRTDAPYSFPTGPGDQAAEYPGGMKGIGDTLNGRFVLEECIGFGGMGTVYRALDLRKLEASDRKPYIAIKVLNVQFRGHPKSLIALQREARKAQTLAHPNIVTVYDFDRDGSTVFLTMEYLSGKPLGQLLRSSEFKAMPHAEAMRIIGGIAKALAYSHERGFVHCDLKPANVFLTDRGEVKVIDFGIARVFKKPEDETDATVFDAGSLGGMTPAYASPEMLEHGVPDPRDDIYALACITYELLTGQHPFNRLAATQARSAGLKPQRPAGLGQRQWRTLRNALSFARETRTATVLQFLKGMEESGRTGARIGLGTAGLAIAGLLAAAFIHFRGAWDDAAPPPPNAADDAALPRQAEPVRPVKPALAVLSLAAVEPVLARVPCSALTASVSGNTVTVKGYLSRDVGLARLEGMLGAVPGAQSVKLDVLQISNDKCRAISAFAPYWMRTRQAGASISIRTRAPNSELSEGDPLIVDVKTPAYDSYVNVDYFSLDGNVAHLIPGPRARNNQAPPNYEAAIGSMGNWVIGKPFGSELIVLFATPAPMFGGSRPGFASTADYLQAVEAQLSQMAGKYGPDRIAVDFVQITTKARKP